MYEKKNGSNFKFLKPRDYSEQDLENLRWLARNEKRWGVQRYDYVSCRVKESIDSDYPEFTAAYSKRPFNTSTRYFSKSEFYDMKRELGLIGDHEE